MMDAEFKNLILSKSPIALYDFTEISLNYPNITNYGSADITAVWQGGVPTLAYGKFGMETVLDGTKWVKLSGGATFDVTEGMTIEALISMDEYRVNARIMDFCTSTTTWYPSYRAVLMSGALQNISGSFRTSGASSSGNIAVDYDTTALSHIMVVSGVSSVKIYINGVLAATAGNTVPFTSLGVGIGTLFYSLYGILAATSDTILKGRVGFVAAYNTSLTAADAAEHFGSITSILGRVPKLELTTDLVFANSETRAKAWPGENSTKETASQSPEKTCPITSVSALNAPPSREDFGFIEGVVTRKSTPAAGKYVICLDERFNLIAETVSAENGYYRFDSLLINGLYAIHAYDNDTYQYAPVGADRRTPEAYP